MTSIRVNNFDLIRLVAAFQVVLVHGIDHFGLQNKVNPSIWFWMTVFPGVPIFFVISGFLISRSLERSHDTMHYAINRLLRIYPALYVCFFVTIVTLLVASPHLILSAKAHEFAGWCFAQLTVAQFFNPSFLRSYGVGVINGSLWTIPVELQFYLALPITYKLLGLSVSKGNALLITVLLGFLGLSLVLDSLIQPNVPLMISKMIAVTMFPYYWMFLLGVLTQRNWAVLSPLFEGRLFPWTIGYCLIVFLMYRLGLPVGGNTQFPLVTVALTGVVLSAAFTLPTVSQRILRGNDMSYGIYIYHMVVINFLIAFDIRDSWSSLLIAMLLTISLGCLSWKAVEEFALSFKPKSRLKDCTQSDLGVYVP